MESLPPESDTSGFRIQSLSARPEQSSGAMLATIDGTESLPREATLTDSLVPRTTEPDTSKRRASNGSLFIHRLPNEIFLHFITLVLADHRPNSAPWKVYTRTGELKLVCVLWADRINSYPCLWNVLTNRRGPGLVLAVLRRSRDVPLYVDISFISSQCIKTYITVIKSIAHRWNTLKLSQVGVSEEVLRELLQLPAPQLQELSIADSSTTPTTAIHLFGGQAPLLHTATITTNEWSTIRPIIPRLKHLVVEPSFAPRQTSQLTLDMIVQALTASPEIEVLKFGFLGLEFAASADALTIPSRPILLSRLRSITLDQVHSEAAIKLLAAISFPRDCAVNISTSNTPGPGSLDPVFSILYAQFTQVAPLGIDIQFKPWGVSVVLSYERDGAGRVEIKVNRGRVSGGHIKGFVEDVLRQLGEAIRASSISVHLRIGRKDTDKIFSTSFPCKLYKSIVETVDGLLPSATRASIYGLHFAEFINYAESGFANLSELIIEETMIGPPWMQLVEVAKSRLCEAADPGSRVAALQSISLPSKGLDEAARERLSRVVEQLNWTDDPHGTRFTLRA